MRKLICALLLTTGLFALNGGGTAATASPSDPPSWGGCRWQCPNTGKWYLTASACDAACTAECDEIC